MNDGCRAADLYLPVPFVSPFYPWSGSRLLLWNDGDDRGSQLHLQVCGVGKEGYRMGWRVHFHLFGMRCWNLPPRYASGTHSIRIRRLVQTAVACLVETAQAAEVMDFWCI